MAQPSKTCPKCGETKPTTAFAKRKSSKSGLQYHCRACCDIVSKAWRKANPDRSRELTARWVAANAVRHKAGKRDHYKANKAAYRANALKHKYGITPAEYDNLLETQAHGCAVCSASCPTGKRLAVDHSHSTGAVRGLLCSRCNTAIGLLKDAPDNLAAALRYLAKHGEALTSEGMLSLLDALDARPGDNPKP